MFANRQSLLSIFFILVWVGLFAFGVYRHEFWRDEMRALSIAISAPSFSDLPAYLKNEGHPILWYAVLKLAYQWVHATWVLPALSFLFSFGIVLLIMFRSPFPLLIKLLIIFGVYALYEYGINCRNYGIAAFFMLLFANHVMRYPKSILIAFIYLSLAAMSNVYAAMLGGLIALYFVHTYHQNYGTNVGLVMAILILLSAIAFSLYTMLPDANSLVASKKVIDFISIKEVWLVGYGFDDFLNYKMHFSAYVLSLVLVGCLLVFLPHLKLVFAMVLALLAMSFFSLCIKGNMMHHQGMYYYLVVVMAWIHYEDIKAALNRKNLVSLLVLIGAGLNVFVLGIQLLKGYEKYEQDILSLKSESKSLGAWCNKHLGPKDLLIAEPDYTMEGVMYYHYQPFYIPRENTKGTYVHFTKANKAFLSLDTLMMTADSLSISNKQVYLVFEKRVQNVDSVYSYSYSKKFKVSKLAFKTLSERFELIDSFHHNHHNEENFYLYRRNVSQN